MPLPVFKTAEEIPESFRPEYVEVDGQWVPKAETDLAAEKRKRAELLNEKREEKRLREEAEVKLAAATREAEARANGVSEEQLKKIRDDEARAREPIEKERDRYKGLYEKATLTDRVQSLALAAGVMPDRIKQAMKLLKDRTRLGDAGGIIVLDEDEKETAETIDDFLAKTFKKENSFLYAGSGASGSGASGSNGSGGGTTTDTTTQAQALERKRETMPGTL